MRSRPAGVTALAFALSLPVLIWACDSGPDYSQLEGPNAPAHDQPGMSHATANDQPGTTHATPELNRELAALRRLVAPFHNFNRAQAAGWVAPVTPCLEHPTEGGMGFHFGNPAYINDGGAVAVTQPELLLFEPMENGQMRFVGVEYIVLFTDIPQTDPPPVLFGMEFHPVPDAGLWGLHAWVGRHNPSGMFADWNPLVSCEFAPEP